LRSARARSPCNSRPKLTRRPSFRLSTSIWTAIAVSTYDSCFGVFADKAFNVTLGPCFAEPASTGYAPESLRFSIAGFDPPCNSDRSGCGCPHQWGRAERLRGRIAEKPARDAGSHEVRRGHVRPCRGVKGTGKRQHGRDSARPTVTPTWCAPRGVESLHKTKVMFTFRACRRDCPSIRTGTGSMI
jgi:hypothetical protein